MIDFTLSDSPYPDRNKIWKLSENFDFILDYNGEKIELKRNSMNTEFLIKYTFKSVFTNNYREKLKQKLEELYKMSDIDRLFLMMGYEI